MLVFPTISNLDGIKYTRNMFDEYFYRASSRYDNNGQLFQLDDNAVGFFQRRLEQNVGRIFEAYAPELTFDQDCVQEYDLDPGAEDVVYTAVDGRGEARIIGGATQDVRLSSTQAEEVKLKTARIASGFQYTEKELDNMILSAKQGVAFDIKEQRIKKAVKALDELSENLGYYGSNEHNILGMLNNPAVTIVDSDFEPYNNKTANELYAFFVNLYFTVLDATQETMAPNVCRMSLNMFRLLTETRDSESNATAWELIQNLFNDPTTVQNRVAFRTRNALRNNYLKRNGIIASNDDDEIIMFYHLSPDTTVRKINAIRSKPLEMEGFNYVGRLFYDVSSVMMPYTKAVNFVKYSTATA